jgi:hypothetical protein
VKTEDGNVSELIISKRKTGDLEDVRPKGEKMGNNQTRLKDLRQEEILDKSPKIFIL